MLCTLCTFYGFSESYSPRVHGNYAKKNSGKNPEQSNRCCWWLRSSQFTSLSEYLIPFSLSVFLFYPMNLSITHSVFLFFTFLSVSEDQVQKKFTAVTLSLSLSLSVLHTDDITPPVARGLSHRSILACTDWYHATGMPPSWSPHFPQWRLVDRSWYCINLLGQTPSRQDISNSFDQPML